MAQSDHDAELAYMADPSKCPFCGNDDLGWEAIDAAAPLRAICSVYCEQCGAKWMEIYKMTAVTIEQEGRVSQQIIKAMRDRK